MYVSDVESYMMDWDWETNKKKTDTITIADVRIARKKKGNYD